MALYAKDFMEYTSERYTLIGMENICLEQCQDIRENCQRHMLCILANPLTKHTLLVIWQIYDGFSTSKNKNSSLVLKPCKSVQETSEEVLFIKAQQIARQNHVYRELMLKLDSSSTETVSIENYEIRIS